MSDLGKIEQFRARVVGLIERFEADLDRDEWKTRRYPERFRDDDRGIHEIPALPVQKGPACLLLDPIGFDIPGAEGAVDIYELPAYDPGTTLHFEQGEWKSSHALPDDLGAVEPDASREVLPVNAATIKRVLDATADHVVAPI